MRFAMLRVMALNLLRDRAALIMSFILPGIVYIIFATIFAGASGGDLTVRLAVADARGDATSKRLLTDPRLARVGGATLSPEDARALVRRGDADAAIVIRAGGRGVDDLNGAGLPAIEIVGNPGREIAVTLLQGAVQKAYFASLPDAAVRSIADLVDTRMAPFTAEQKIRIAKGLDAMRDAKPSAEPQGFRLDRLFERRDAVAAGAAPSAVTYYAGAVAMLFLLFSALTGAMSYLEERESGLLDRLAASPGGIGVLIDGKFLFLALQGFLQVLIIYLVAWVAFGVALPERIGPWAATTAVAACAASGLAMAFVTLCRSKQQAQTLGQMLILVVSAVGGSMVPRYLMPPFVQSFGWATPNTWALEAYGAVFVQADEASALLVPWAVLGTIGALGLFVAHMSARRVV